MPLVAENKTVIIIVSGYIILDLYFIFDQNHPNYFVKHTYVYILHLTEFKIIGDLPY